MYRSLYTSIGMYYVARPISEHVNKCSCSKSKDSTHTRSWLSQV